MSTTFNTHTDAGDGYGYAVAVTPSDVTDLTYTTRAIYVGGAGNIVVTMQTGDDITFNAVAAGTILRVKASRIKATGTTATLIVALA